MDAPEAIRAQIRKQRLLRVLKGFFLLVSIAAMAAFVTGVRFVRVKAGTFPREELANEWTRVLTTVVRDGGVDYDGVHAHGHELARLITTLAEEGPRSAPDAYPDEASQLAFAINAYNAYVLFLVEAYQPESSVHDVRGWIEPKEGFGFFYGLHFRVDGALTNLYRYEREVVMAFGDARAHAAINCASRSCPPLGTEAYRAETLDAQLDAAAARFASAPHVVVDDEAETLTLSSIYDWYADDFRAHAAEIGAGDEALDWVRHYAPEADHEGLDRAIEGGYAVRYAPYDWSLNRAPELLHE